MNVTAHDMEHEAFEALCRLSNSSDWFMQVARQQQLADEFLTKQTDDLQRMSALVSQGLRLQVHALHISKSEAKLMYLHTELMISHKRLTDRQRPCKS